MYSDVVLNLNARRLVSNSTAHSTLPSKCGKRALGSRCQQAAPRRSSWNGQTSAETPPPACLSAWACCSLTWDSSRGLAMRWLVRCNFWRKHLLLLKDTPTHTKCKYEDFFISNCNVFWDFDGYDWTIDWLYLTTSSISSHQDSIGIFHSVKRVFDECFWNVLSKTVKLCVPLASFPSGASSSQPE